MFEFSNPEHIHFPSTAEDLLGKIKAILLELQEAGINAVVGGGVLRDLFLHAPYKDIDIFADAEASDGRIISILQTMGFTSRVVVSNEATEYLSFTDVASVIEATHPALEAAVQVVRMSKNNTSPEAMIARLDLGPCQVGMDYRGAFWATDQFKDDIFNQTFTVTRSESRDIERSTKRFDRLVLKYPGWKLVIP